VVADTPLLELRSIDKSFPGVRALSDMSISFRRAAVHVICGENGAGKSTLMKIVNGLYQPDSGEIWIDGKQVHVRTPIEARSLGISMISQELNYIPEITVEESLFLGIEPVDRTGRIDWPQIRKRTIALLQSEGLAYNPRTKLKDLSVSDVQMLEIMKAVSQQASIIIMDEPTSAITATEVEILFAKIAELKAKGAAIIYISHRLAELFRIADDITVIRDGTHVATRPAKELTIDGVIQLMVGRSIDNVFPPRPERRFGPTVIEVTGLSDGEKFRDVDFHIRGGEIVGFSGLMGAGRSEVARTVFGLDAAAAGSIRIKGAPAAIRNPHDSMRLGMAMLSEDRKRYGLIPVRDIKENVGLSSLGKFFFGGFLHKRTENDLVSAICSRMRVKAPSLATRVEALSGGNQQKVVFAKWMLRDPDILILDEPTRGIDVGSKLEIYKIIFELAEEGKAILLISSELPEILALCDRVYVMAQGHVASEFEGPHFDQERIMKFATMGAGAEELEAGSHEAAAVEARPREASGRVVNDESQGDRI
jgi:inositol transport system ATP-binding protein